MSFAIKSFGVKLSGKGPGLNIVIFPGCIFIYKAWHESCLFLCFGGKLRGRGLGERL